MFTKEELQLIKERIQQDLETIYEVSAIYGKIEDTTYHKELCESILNKINNQKL